MRNCTPRTAGALIRAFGAGKEQAMWEIIADPREYGIEILEEGINNHRLVFPDETSLMSDLVSHLDRYRDWQTKDERA